ncbi:hypothetical protein [Romboutsia hominis]|nr:hypothetical protein [Romboutsia hominis]MCH1969542.1 hypothetical protein [Romboutsia hominis]
MKKFVQSYKPYMFLLEVYYTLNDKKNFEKVIKSLRESDIKLDKEGLDILRFWIEGDNSV